jgi:hypothetical protein
MTPEQMTARTRRAVVAARALISQEHGLVYGCKRVSDALDYLGDEMPKTFPTFRQFLDRIPPALPLGEARLFCTEQLLLESDAKLAVIEAEFRASLLRESQAVIKALASK